VTINLEGQPRPNFSGATSGAILLPQQLDRPAINIQGGRNCRIAGLAIRGRFQQAFIRAFATYDAVLPAARSEWLDTANIPNGLARYAPYAAITIDAYSGPRPVAPNISYPDVRYPAWLVPTPLQFGRAFSSVCVIENCDIEGFAVGIANQPSTVDGNADFTRIRSNNFSYCIHAIAVCNSQSRNVEIRNNNFLACHTFLTNGYFGAGIGQLGGPVENNSGSRIFQFIDVPNAGYSGNVEFRANYVEELGRIGVWAVAGSARAGRCIFSSCQFYFIATMMPRALLDCATTIAPVFQACTFLGLRRMPHLVWGGSGLVIDGCVWDAGRDYTGQDHRGHGPKNLAIAKAYSTLGGLFTTHAGLADKLELRGISEGISFLPSAPWKLEPRQLTADLGTDGYHTAVIDHPGCRWLVDSSGRRWPILWRPVPQLLPKHASLFPVLPTQTGMQLAGSYHVERQTASGLSAVMEPGDILYDVPTGNIFILTFVSPNTATGHYDFKGELHNNYNVVQNVPVPSSVIGATSNLVLVKSGVVVPTTIYWGDFAAGSTEVSNVHRGDGYARELESHVYVGMWIGADNTYGKEAGNAVPANTRIQSVKSGSPGSLTLDRPSRLSGRFPLLPIRIS
jgi:hypothetical protein